MKPTDDVTVIPTTSVTTSVTPPASSQDDKNALALPSSSQEDNSKHTLQVPSPTPPPTPAPVHKPTPTPPLTPTLTPTLTAAPPGTSKSSDTNSVVTVVPESSETSKTNTITPDTSTSSDKNNVEDAPKPSTSKLNQGEPSFSFHANTTDETVGSKNAKNTTPATSSLSPPAETIATVTSPHPDQPINNAGTQNTGGGGLTPGSEAGRADEIGGNEDAQTQAPGEKVSESLEGGSGDARPSEVDIRESLRELDRPPNDAITTSNKGGNSDDIVEPDGVALF